jgi:AcrR family transcriptional regulator
MTEDISAVQLHAIALLLEGRDVPDVAKTIGIDRSTLYRYLKDDEAFKSAYASAKAETLTKALNILAEGLSSASKRARELLQSPNDSVALRACATIINGYSSLHSSAKTEQRLLELEEGLRVLNGNNNAQV